MKNIVNKNEVIENNHTTICERINNFFGMLMGIFFAGHDRVYHGNQEPGIRIRERVEAEYEGDEDQPELEDNANTDDVVLETVTSKESSDSEWNGEEDNEDNDGISIFPVVGEIPQYPQQYNLGMAAGVGSGASSGLFNHWGSD